MRNENDFFATTAKGMESLLAQELREMGITEIQEKRAGVAFRGTLEAGYRACLWSRIANRILLPLRTFSAPDADALYQGVRSIHWTDHLTSQNTLAVDFSSSHSALTHTYFGALKVKDAIVDQFRTLQGLRPSVSVVCPDLRINVYVHENQATVSLDLSGESLHQRGYRKEGSKAPLKENLAAAILKLAGWPRQDQGAFLDPLCGSGTLPIEAAMMSLRMAPGLHRSYFGFLGWLGHVPVLWKRLRQEALDCQVSGSKIPKIVGYEGDFRAVRAALQNLERAQLRGRVHIEKRDFSHCEPIASHGVFLTNPPYGERLGDIQQLKGMYRQMGDLLKKKFTNWEGYIFTGSSDLAKSIGLKPAQRFVLFNGAIECRLLKFDLY